MNKERHLIVISGPSGSGKDTVVKRLMELHPEIEVSVSATTREIRPGEKDGVNYVYLTREEFERRIQAGEILEYAEYCGNYYGTPKSEVDKRINNGTTVILVIEVIGAGNVKRIYPGAVTIFVRPPSYGELEERLRGRGTEDEETIQKRLAKAREEIPHAKDYDYIVYNNALEDAVSDLRAIIKAEKLKFSRNTNSIERVLEDAETVR